MTKIKNEPISAQDIEDYLSQTDDFALEMKSLNETVATGLSCSHGGTYEDPVTNKPRQYDIRASYQSDLIHIKFAIECKALTTSHPLVISRVPRPECDSFNEFAARAGSGGENGKCFIQNKEESIYLPGQPVGKSCNQLGKKIDGSWTSNDSEVYDKWSQAIASCSDLISDFVYMKSKEQRRYRICAVFPILIIPKDTLWCVDYNNDGKLLGPPQKVTNCDYFIGRNYSFRLIMSYLTYTISHLHFVTSDSYKVFLEQLIRNTEKQLIKVNEEINSPINL